MSDQNNPRPILVYIGSGKTRDDNLAALRRLARKYAGTSGRSKEGNISGFIKKIIDGDLIVIDPSEYRRQESDSPAAS